MIVIVMARQETFRKYAQLLRTQAIPVPSVVLTAAVCAEHGKNPGKEACS
jgi:hypothetical protein